MMRHAARRFSLSGTAPPLRGRKVAATPYALLSTTPSPTVQTPLLRLQPRRADEPLSLCPARPRPSPSLSHRHTSHTHIEDKPGVLLSKEKKNGKEETSGGDSPPMQHPREGLPSPKLCLSITPKPAAARGALGAACRTAVARGQAPEDEWN